MYCRVKLAMTAQVISPLLFQANHIRGEAVSRQIEGPLECAARAVALHCRLILLQTVVEITRLLVATGLYEGLK